ncbi:uncharacterized protein isoform X2 [Leptinotarsa decemlineata]|uniref:uncharacterized protein isoform X2 n=1 Tax=Leptinotarsa decemlineata TaxID=7539 RepID=UPI003D305471
MVKYVSGIGKYRCPLENIIDSKRHQVCILVQMHLLATNAPADTNALVVLMKSTAKTLLTITQIALSGLWNVHFSFKFLVLG